MLDLSGDTVMIFGATKPKMAETLFSCCCCKSHHVYVVWNQTPDFFQIGKLPPKMVAPRKVRITDYDFFHLCVAYHLVTQCASSMTKATMLFM